MEKTVPSSQNAEPIRTQKRSVELALLQTTLVKGKRPNMWPATFDLRRQIAQGSSFTDVPNASGADITWNAGESHAT